MAQQVGVGGQPDAGRQAGEGAAGVVGVDRGAPLGAEHQVELDRLGGRPGSTHRSDTVWGCPQASRKRACWRRCWRSAWAAKAGRVRMALLAADLTGPTASSLRRLLASPSPWLASGRTAGSTMARAWRNRTVPAS